jgi:hypothetical protein
MTLDQKVWGPHYWFFLHTVAKNYPCQPNRSMKRKHYDLIMNMPVFLPHPEAKALFIKLLDKYPVTPYLDKGADFRHWVHFIHNEVNKALGKGGISREYATELYMEHYEPEPYCIENPHYLYMIMVLVLLAVIYMVL